jgi:DNA-binding NarL/FixJ family response regulator
MRCLLVDDNDAFLEAASTLLCRQGVTVVGTASTVAEGLRLASTLRPDIVLVDIGLGSENGFDLARLLVGNADGAGGYTAVIMISTGAEADYAELIAESPAAGFLPKAELSAAGIQRILPPTLNGRGGR